MSELDYRCTHCGAVGLIEEETAEYFICASCGTKVIKKKSEELIENIKKQNLEATANELCNYRESIKNALEFKNSQIINDMTKEILKLIPNDFEANLFSKFIHRQKYPQDYIRFLSTIYQNYTKEEVEQYLDFIIKNARFDEVKAINAIMNHFKFDESYLEKLELRERQMNQELDDYANITRDVFICHSSKDASLLDKVVGELEHNQGLSTWYSERNIPWDTENYWDNIREAIKNCKVFLLLITENAKFSPDVKKELSICNDLKKSLRAGYYALKGNPDPGIQIRSFFSQTGSEWIREDAPNSLEMLTNRIVDLEEYELNKQNEAKNVVINEPKTIQKEEVKEKVQDKKQADNLSPLLDRAFMFIEDEEWDDADKKLEQVLDKDPENAKAYLGKLLIELKVKTVKGLNKLKVPFASSKNYKKVIRFGDDALINQVEGANNQIQARIDEKERLAKEAEERKKEEARQKELARQRAIEEERIRKEKEEEAKRLAEIKRLEELKKAEEERLRKIEEEKIRAQKAEEERIRKLEEEKRKAEEERLRKIEEEKAKEAAKVKEIADKKKAVETAFKDFKFTYESTPAATKFKVSLQKYNGFSKDLKLPSSIEKIKELEITIDGDLFKPSTVLTTLTISSAVKKIKEGALNGAKTIKNIVVEDNELYKSIDNGLYFMSDILIYGNESTIISDKCFRIASYAFSGNKALEKIDIPVSVESIDEHAFDKCSALTNVVIHEAKSKFLYIYEFAFQDCTALKTLKLPKRNYKIDASAFNGIKNLNIEFLDCRGKWKDSIRNPVTKNQTYLYNNDVKVKYITDEYDNVSYAKQDFDIKDNKTGYTINKYLLNDSSCIIPKKIANKPVQTIGKEFELGEIEKLILPEFLDEIEDGAFKNRKHNIVTIEIDDKNKNFEYVNHCLVRKELKKLILANANFSIPNDIEWIGENALSELVFDRIELPETLEYINERAFYHCASLKEIKLPSSLKEISKEAFSESGIKQVTIPEGLTVLDEGIFKNCKSLEHVDLPQSLRCIEDGLFEGCVNLKNINLPEDVEEIGKSAFKGTAITSITIPEGITTIPENCFEGCTNLMSVKLPETLTTIGRCAFRSCLKLEDITIPKDVTMVYSNSFEYSPCLKNIKYEGGGKQKKNLKAVLFPPKPKVKKQRKKIHLNFSWIKDVFEAIGDFFKVIGSFLYKILINPFVLLFGWIGDKFYDLTHHRRSKYSSSRSSKSSKSSYHVKPKMNARTLFLRAIPNWIFIGFFILNILLNGAITYLFGLYMIVYTIIVITTTIPHGDSDYNDFKNIIRNKLLFNDVLYMLNFLVMGRSLSRFTLIFDLSFFVLIIVLIIADSMSYDWKKHLALFYTGLSTVLALAYIVIGKGLWLNIVISIILIVIAIIYIVDNLYVEAFEIIDIIFVVLMFVASIICKSKLQGVVDFNDATVYSYMRWGLLVCFIVYIIIKWIIKKIRVRY